MEITSIIQHVFKQPSLEGVSLAELERFTARQPFFAVGQYLLLKKMQDIRDPGFEKQLQKTRLYFENPLWLQQLLRRQNDVSNAAVHHEPGTDVIESRSEENKTDEFVSDNGTPGFRVQERAEETFIPSNEEVTTEESALEENRNIELAEQVVPGTPEPEIAVVDEPVVKTIPIDLPQDRDTTEEPEPLINKFVQAPNDNSEDNENPGEIEEGKPGFVLPVYLKPPEQTEEKLVFQAYHTIDYFASQGIKISNKAEMSDKLGSQLKSFTEWLKTMKRLPPSKIEQQMEEKESEVVIEMAAHSLESKEVLTETMAEVLLKQGKKESAIEVYNKLSLLNPSKTPYFAAKIEEIKRN